MVLALDGSGYTAGSAATTVAAPALTTVNANCVIYVCIQANSNGYVTSVTDTAGLTFFPRVGPVPVPSNPGQMFATYYAIATSPLVSDVITAHFFATANSPVITVFGVSGANVAAPFDPNPTVPTIGTVYGQASTSITTTNPHCMIIGFFRQGSTATPTAGPGFTQIQGASYNLVEYLLVSTTQTALAITEGTGSGNANGQIGDAITSDASATETVVITASGSGTWYPPGDCPAGTVIAAECWGAGSGGTGRVSSTFGAAGAGGAYAQSPYTVTSADTTNGISYTVGAGTAGLSGANPAAGGNTSWATSTTIAAGGGAPSGTTGGVGGTTAASTGTTSKFAGGSGAAYNVNGSGGGGVGGPVAVGATGTTAGVGGQGDGTRGGWGGIVASAAPAVFGSPGSEGGGGGGGLKTVAGTGGAGGAPGGGGGGAAVATGTGGAGANGQIRLTYTPGAAVAYLPYEPWPQMAPILAQ